ncbi:RES family NAD+ phosphorylase [Solidesulfovibrio sp.]|uniref:RES family NAD+ phosphorylase n=1 Tax=Solidesulfovibrio sp. TaxID=2910990 RepID=UPI0026334AFF|nr:RES family NAD+ phosphorylase [Solidesulfovibrio sp.]
MSGIGAKDYGGRWNDKGIAVVYAASSLSLAALEILVHVADYALLGGIDYSCIRLDFAPGLVARVDAAALPADWQDLEHPACKRSGSEWARGALRPVLAVPSAVIALETNYLLNPLHPDFARIAASAPQPFSFDARLVKQAP